MIERTVQDVLPALKTNSDGLKQVLEEILKQYKSKQDEMEKWKVRRGPSHAKSTAKHVYEQKKNNVQVVQNP